MMIGACAEMRRRVDLTSALLRLGYSPVGSLGADATAMTDRRPQHLLSPRLPSCSRARHAQRGLKVEPPFCAFDFHLPRYACGEEMGSRKEAKRSACGRRKPAEVQVRPTRTNSHYAALPDKRTPIRSIAGVTRVEDLFPVPKPVA